MKTSSASTAGLCRSVWAVPSLAGWPNFKVNPAANIRLVKHIEAGGASTILYGGNANLYHAPLSEYGELLELEILRVTIQPFQVLHSAVTLSGVAKMGPLLPMLSDLPLADQPAVEKAARALMELDRAVAAGDKEQPV